MKRQRKKKINKNGKKTVKRKAQGNDKSRNLIVALVIAVPVLCLLIFYLVGAGHYRNRFLKGTVIDQVDVSGMTISELEDQIGRYSLRLIERQADGTYIEEKISGSEIGMSYSSKEPLRNILQDQNSFLWIFKQNTDYQTEDFPFYNEAALEEKVSGLTGFREEFVKDPEDAYIGDYVPGKGFELVAENPGNRLDRDKTIEAVKEAVGSMEEQVNLEEAGCYEVPKVTVEDAKLKDTYASLQKYGNVVITYTFGTEKEVLDGDVIAGWIVMDGEQVTLDRSCVEEYVASLRKKYDTIFRTRNFQTSYGVEVTIDQGDYGWWMNTDQETEELIEMLERGESGERVPVYRQTAASHETPDYGDTYVEINLSAQHLLLYLDGECVLESDFVSGNPSRGNDTPTGIYGITYKERDATLKGENYRTPVSYWMPFNNNVGMHDAGWRSEFGGNIYLKNGSHGCINLPSAIAQQIYDYVEKGTPVICYRLPGTEPEPLPEDPAGSEDPVESEAAEGLEGAEEGLTEGAAAGADTEQAEPGQPEE